MNRGLGRWLAGRLAAPLLAALLAGCGEAPAPPAADPDEVEKAVAKAELQLEAAENGSAFTSRETEAESKDSGS